MINLQYSKNLIKTYE